MIEIKTIVAATDMSDLGMQAVHHAAELSAAFDADLHLITVMPYPFREFMELCRDEFDCSLDDYEQSRFESLKSALADVAISSVDESKVTRLAIKGTPLEEVIAYVTECEASLLVVATHGHTGVRRAVMGSVAENIVRHAPCPVLTVHASDAREPTTQQPNNHHHSLERNLS